MKLLAIAIIAAVVFDLGFLFGVLWSGRGPARGAE